MLIAISMSEAFNEWMSESLHRDDSLTTNTSTRQVLMRQLSL